MLKPVLLPCLILASSLSFAEIYEWTDENGKKVYGDKPKPKVEAQALDVEPANILPFPKNRNRGKGRSNSQEKSIYQQFSIASPAQNATIRDNTGSVSIKLLIKPDLVKGHALQVYLDNTPHQNPKQSSTIVLKNIDRGSHSIKVDLLDESGNILQSSQSITFHMHRHSVKKAP